MINIRPSVFCFLGRLASELQASVPFAIRRRLGTVPDIFAFVSVTEEGVDLRIGSQRPKLPSADVPLQGRVWNAISTAASAIGNIRVRTESLRRPAEASSTFQVVRGGPDVYIVQCLSDPMGWELAFSIAEKIHQRNESPPSAGRARGIFPLFHLPSDDEDAERAQALDGLKRLEKLVERGVLFPSLVLDRVNRNGYPLERWEDLTEFISDFLALGSASEAAGDIWRFFPQVADLHASELDKERDGPPGLSSLGLARFRFNRELVGQELGHFFMRDLKRILSGTFATQPGSPTLEECLALLAGIVQLAPSTRSDGSQVADREIVAWVRRLHGDSVPDFGSWAAALDRLQRALFERLGEITQRIENARQEDQALSMESPLRDTWIARLSVLVPPRYTYLPSIFGGALLGSLFGTFVSQSAPFRGYFWGGALGAFAGWAVAHLLVKRWGTKDTFTLGEFPEGSFSDSVSVPRTLERFSRTQQPARRRSGNSLQLWGELRSQLEPGAKDHIDQAKERIRRELEGCRKEETELIFMDRVINALRECAEAWRSRLGEVETWEPGRGFSGDIFPADGPRRIYEWAKGREAAEKAAAGLLPEIDPSLGSDAFLERALSVALAWGREQATTLTLQQVLEILDDRPDDLIERLSEASAPLWPRPGDRDELIRCFGADFEWLAKPTDLRHSVEDETIFIRVLGGIKSAELAIRT